MNRSSIEYFFRKLKEGGKRLSTEDRVLTNEEKQYFGNAVGVPFQDSNELYRVSALDKDHFLK